MTQFVLTCGLVLVAALLGTTGGTHLLRQRRLVRLVGHHGLLGPALARVGAFGLTMSELAIATIALTAVVIGDRLIAGVASVAALIAGVIFLAYLRRLHRIGYRGSCGCMPLEAVLTPASFAPAIALSTFGALGLAATLAGGADPAGGAAWAPLPIAWGLVLCGLVVLLPATAPQIRHPRASETRP